MIIRIEDWKETLVTDEVEANEDLDLYLPRSLARLEASCVSGKLSGKLHNNLTVHYNGTKEEWDKIVKGNCEWITQEDWYGYYYHNAPRYETFLEYHPFWHVDVFNNVMIICHDGEFRASRYSTEDKQLCFQYLKDNNIMGE